jgi:hypothetical protein
MLLLLHLLLRLLLPAGSGHGDWFTAGSCLLRQSAASVVSLASCCCRCLQEVAMATGVLLDPVYSNKALHALLTYRCRCCCCCCRCCCCCCCLQEVAMATGVLLDPFYSGKALLLR